YRGDSSPRGNSRRTQESPMKTEQSGCFCAEDVRRRGHPDEGVRCHQGTPMVNSSGAAPPMTELSPLTVRSVRAWPSRGPVVTAAVALVAFLVALLGVVVFSLNRNASR